MKKSVLVIAALAAFCGAGSAEALAPVATNIPAPSAAMQKNKMRACAKQYQQQKIAKPQYKSFMSQCMKQSATPGNM